MKHLFLAGILFGAFGCKNKNPPIYETVKYSFEFSYTISNKRTYILSMLVSVSSKTKF